jgi:hypothetical protein
MATPTIDKSAYRYAYAYQMSANAYRTDDIFASNVAGNIGDASYIVIRVLGPVGSTFGSVPAAAINSGDADNLQSVQLDQLVSANVVCISEVDSVVDKGGFGGGLFGDINTSGASQLGNYIYGGGSLGDPSALLTGWETEHVVKSFLPGGHAVVDLYIKYTFPIETKTHITLGLTFASGFVDTLGLYLRRPDRVLVNYDPVGLCQRFEQGQGTISINRDIYGGQAEQNAQTFTAYNWSKSFYPLNFDPTVVTNTADNDGYEGDFLKFLHEVKTTSTISSSGSGINSAYGLTTESPDSAQDLQILCQVGLRFLRPSIKEATATGAGGVTPYSYASWHPFSSLPQAYVNQPGLQGVVDVAFMNTAALSNLMFYSPNTETSFTYQNVSGNSNSLSSGFSSNIEICNFFKFEPDVLSNGGSFDPSADVTDKKSFAQHSGWLTSATNTFSQISSIASHTYSGEDWGSPLIWSKFSDGYLKLDENTNPIFGSKMCASGGALSSSTSNVIGDSSNGIVPNHGISDLNATTADNTRSNIVGAPSSSPVSLGGVVAGPGRNFFAPGSWDNEKWYPVFKGIARTFAIYPPGNDTNVFDGASGINFTAVNILGPSYQATWFAQARMLLEQFPNTTDEELQTLYSVASEMYYGSLTSHYGIFGDIIYAWQGNYGNSYYLNGLAGAGNVGPENSSAATIKAQIDVPGIFASMYSESLPYMERNPNLTTDSTSVTLSQDLIGRGEAYGQGLFNHLGSIGLSDRTSTYGTISEQVDSLANNSVPYFAAQDLAVYISSPVYRVIDKNNSALNTGLGQGLIAYSNSWFGTPSTTGIDTAITNGQNVADFTLTASESTSSVFTSNYADTPGVWPVTGKEPILMYPSGNPFNEDGQLLDTRSYPEYLNNATNLANVVDNTRVYHDVPAGTDAATITFGINNCAEVLGTFIKNKSVNTDENRVELYFFFQNNCGGSDLQHSGGTTIVNNFNTNPGDAIDKILEIFPQIRYTPGKFTHGSPDTYELSVEDSTDVDYASILQYTQAGVNIYRLQVIWIADTNDVDPAEVSAPFTNAISDLSPVAWNRTHKVSNGQYLGQADVQLVPGTATINSPKGSAISISTIAKDGSTDIVELDDIYRASKTSASGETDLSLYLPFHVWGEVVDTTEPVVEVPGCTDENAYNYNPEATVDDDSCIYCDDFMPTAYPNTVKLGPTQTVYTATIIGGTSSQLVTSITQGYEPSEVSAGIFSNASYPQLSGAGGVKNCGMFKMSTTENGVLRTATNIPDPKFQTQGTAVSGTVANQIVSLGLNASDIHTAKIYALTETNLGQGFVTDADVQTTAPKTLGTPLVTKTADPVAANPVGGIQNPMFDFTSNFPVYSGGFYIIEIESDFTKVSDCSDISTKLYIYRIFTVGFCGCVVAGNDFTETGWAWSSVSPFPALYTSASANLVCVTAGAPQPGDALYSGDNEVINVCQLTDTQFSSCESYWSWCISNSLTICDTTATIEEYETVINADGIEVLQAPPITTFEIAVEGYWDAYQDIYVVDDSIEYTITATHTSSTDGGVTTDVQTQEDGVLASVQTGTLPIITNYFSFVGSGTISVTITFTAPYNQTNLELTECVFTETFDVVGEGCDTLLEGCTDPAATNYDISAQIDDGSCEYPVDCEQFFLNPAVTIDPADIVTTAATATCQDITVQVGDQSVTYQIEVQNNDGSATISGTITDENAEYDVQQYSVGIVFNNGYFPPPLNDVGGAIDALIANYENATTGEGATLGIDMGWGGWSPLQDLAADGSFTITYDQTLQPGVYSFYVVPLVSGQGNVPEECADEVVRVWDYSFEFIVGSGDVTCEEPCLQLPCEEQVPGCTDPTADNYDPEATIDDGSCEYDTSFCETYPENPICNDCEALAEFLGIPVEKLCENNTGGGEGSCTDPNACNFDPTASLDNTNNTLCDYCSCADPNDTDCFNDNGCESENDPDCVNPPPPCPDPENPDCDLPPTNPCPTPADCPPPENPCVILGNCPTSCCEGTGEEEDVFEDTVTFETACGIDVVDAQGNAITFSVLQTAAMTCMSTEGSRMMYKLKAGVEVDKTELRKLSLIAYIMLGGAGKNDLPCIWNCNYESRDKIAKNTVDCMQNWASGNFRIWTKTDSYAQGQTVAYHYPKNGRLTRGLFVATRDIIPGGVHPMYADSGWKICQNKRLRTVDPLGIADGTEGYMQVFFEYINRYCQSCSVSVPTGTAPTGYVQDFASRDGMDIPKEKQQNNNPFGILDEDGNEIIF